MKPHILATGMSGLVGSRIAELWKNDFVVCDMSLATGVDITNSEQVFSEVEKSSSPVIVHMAAKADVDACEDDRLFGEDGSAWQINVSGTEHVVAAAKKTGKRVLFISTDFVFDGMKECYCEDDAVNPVNWYGETKCEAERIVSSSDISFCIVRIAYPYRCRYDEKQDFVRRIVGKIEKGERVYGLTDHVFTPTFIDDIADALRVLIKKDISGIYHVVGTGSLRVDAAVRMIVQAWGKRVAILPATRDVFFKGRAFRPRNLALRNDKITKLGIHMRSFSEGLRVMRSQQ